MVNLTYAELQGDLIRLRPIQPDDAEVAFPLAHDDRVNRMLIWDGPTSLKVLAEAYEKYSIQWQQSDTYHFAIELLESLAFVGDITVRSETRKSADIGYWLGFPYWGKGYMTEAIKLIAYFAFTCLAADEVQAGVFGGNLASRRVLEKNGFRFEGVLEQQHLKLGQPVDAWQMVVGREEWEKDQGAFRPVYEKVT